MTVPRQVRVVAALISHPSQAGRYLIQQRLPGKSRALLWEFPGGKVEAGEGDAAALVRECREELGVELSVEGYLSTATHAYEDLTVELVLYRGRILKGDPKALGAQALRYADAAEMKGLPFCEADLPLLDALGNGAWDR